MEKREQETEEETKLLTIEILPSLSTVDVAALVDRLLWIRTKLASVDDSVFV